MKKTKRGSYTETQYQALCFARGFGSLLLIVGGAAALAAFFNVAGYLLVTYDVYAFSIPDGWLASNHARWTRVIALAAYGAAHFFFALIVAGFVIVFCIYVYRACLALGGYKPSKAKGD